MNRTHLKRSMTLVLSGVFLAGLLVLSVTFSGRGSAVVAGSLIPAVRAQESATGQDLQDNYYGRPKFHYCTARTVKGTYAFGLTGNVIGVGPIGASGTTTFDGEGNFSITGAVNTTALIPAQEGTFTGTYTVDPDCTARATVEIPAPGLLGFTKIAFRGVIIDRGGEVRYLITTPGVVLAGATVKQ